jgi:hypothetical protein
MIVFYFKNSLARTEKIWRESGRLGDFRRAARLSERISSLMAGRPPKKSEGFDKSYSQ